MMKYIKIYGMILLCLALAACGGSSSDEEDSMLKTAPIIEGDYGALIPYASSDARDVHHDTGRNLIDSYAVGTGLSELSKAHFSPSDYVYQEGKFLKYNELRNNLLKRSGKDYPNGLNPQSGKFDTGNGVVEDIILLADIYEIDWYQNEDLKGISLALVLNPILQKGGTKVEVNKNKLELYGSETARKLVSYLRGNIPEIGDQMPIYIAIYNSTSVDSSLPGTFVQEAYFSPTSKSADFTNLDESWAIFPSDDAKRKDATTANEFMSFKNAMSRFLTDDIDIIGIGHFKNGALVDLSIQVVMRAKTATEAKAATQYLHALISTFSSNAYQITIDVKSDDIHVAVIQRLKDSNDTNVIVLI